MTGYASDGRRIDIASGGAIYVVGAWPRPDYAIGDAYLTISYNPDGSRAWVRICENGETPSSGTMGDEATAMAVDVAGKVYVKGSTASPPSEQTKGICPATYPVGNALLASSVIPPGGTLDWALTLYSSSGSVLWNATFQGTTALNCGDTPVMAASDLLGNLYVLGHQVPENSSDMGFFTIRYGPGGQVLWQDIFDNTNDTPARLALDNSGHAYVTGTTWVLDPSGQPNTRAATIKYTEPCSGSILAHGTGKLDGLQPCPDRDRSSLNRLLAGESSPAASNQSIVQGMAFTRRVSCAGSEVRQITNPR
jgi:hypothetical protein